MITPPITKDDIGRKFRNRRADYCTVLAFHPEKRQPVTVDCCDGDIIECDIHGRFFDEINSSSIYDLIERIPLEVTFTPEPAFLKRVSTTNPNEGADPDSGVMLLARHFQTNERIYPDYARNELGIGRLSARVFDLNQALYEIGNRYTIKCVKKTITKKNGRKARVTDYYQFVEVTE